jgi:hypothetical protein
MSIVLFMSLYCSCHCTVHVYCYCSCYCTVHVYYTVHAIALFMSLYCSCYCTVHVIALWTVQYQEQYNRHEQYNDINSTIAWTVQWHEQYNDMSSTITSFQCKCCISSIAHETFIGLDYMSNTSSVLKETRTAYPSRAPWFPPDVWWVRVAKLFSCMCCGFKTLDVLLI